MSAQFASASSQYLQNAAPSVLDYPFTVAGWFCPASVATLQTIWALGDTATTTESFRIQVSSAGVLQLSASTAGGGHNSNLGTLTAGQWVFFVGRYISSTNRRGAALQYNGAINHVSNAVSRAPASLDTMRIGSRVTTSAGDYADGRLGEYWLTNTDIQADGAQLQDSTLRHLAMNGPFALPHLAKDIVEYRSFRSRLDSRQDRPDEVYYRGTRPVWTNTNGVTLGPHPPAGALWRKPTSEYGGMVIA